MNLFSQSWFSKLKSRVENCEPVSLVARMPRVPIVALIVWLFTLVGSAQADGSVIERAFKEGGAPQVVLAAKAIEKEAGAAQAVEVLTQALLHQDIPLRAAAAHALGLMGDPAKAAVPALVKAFGNTGKAGAYDVARAVKQLGSGDIPLWLAEAVVRPGDPFDEEALDALYNLSPQDARIVPHLITTMASSSKDVKWRAVVLLGDLKSLAAPARPALVRLLKATPVQNEAKTTYFSEEDIRARAAFALGCIAAEPKETMSLLLGIVKDTKNTSELRKRATMGLGQMGDKASEAIPALIAMMDDEQLVLDQVICIYSADYTEHAATTALVHIGKASIPALVSTLESKQAAIRLRGVEALGCFGSEAKSAIPSLVRRLRDKEESAKIKSGTLDALSTIGFELNSFVPELLPLIHDEDPEVREDAVDTLSYLEPQKESLEVMFRLLDDPAPEVRIAALTALGHITSDEQLKPVIARLVKDPDESVREAAQEQEDLLLKDAKE